MKNHRRGFTLVELVIAITVTTIVFGMVTTFCVGISNFSRERSTAVEMQEELVRAKQFMSNWVKTLDDAFNSNFTVTADSREVRLKSGNYRWNEGHDADNYFALRFNETSGVMTADYFVDGAADTRAQTFHRIKTVRFARGDEANGLGNVVKCVLTFKEDTTVHTFILHKESSSASVPVIFNKPHEVTADGYQEFVFVTSADWEDMNGNNEQTGYMNLQELAQYASYQLSAAYQQATLNLIQIQVDGSARMSLSAFSALYGSEWRVRIFPAGGKVAYGMALSADSFDVAAHKIAFFIREGSTLYDGTPVEPMGYVREKGAIGTGVWQTASSFDVYGEQMDGTNWIVTFQTDVVWRDAGRTVYTGLEDDAVAQSYGLSQTVRDGIQNGILITINYDTYTLKEFQALTKASGATKGPISISARRTEPEGNMQIQLSIPRSALINGGGIYAKFGFLTADRVIITFEESFLLPNGAPLMEKMIFSRDPAEFGVGTWKKAATVISAGELLDGSAEPTKGNSLSSYTTFSMEFQLNAPWTDTKYTAYNNLQNQDTAASTYGLSASFFEGLYDWVFVGKNSGEQKLRAAMTSLKMSISLRKGADGNTVLRFDIPTAQMVAAGYPLDITTRFINVRFGADGLENNKRTIKFFYLPDGSPVVTNCFVRLAAPAGASVWSVRHVFAPSPKLETKNDALLVGMFTTAQWPASYAARYDNLHLSANLAASPLPASAKKALAEKVYVIINGEKETLQAFNARTGNAFSVHVVNIYGCCAVQLEISSAKQSYINGKTFSIVFEDGFIAADGSTRIVPIQFTRDTAGKWKATYGN